MQYYLARMWSYPNDLIDPNILGFILEIAVRGSSLNDFIIPNNAPIVDWLKKDFPAMPFHDKPENGKFGLGDIMHIREINSDVIIIVNLPSLRFQPYDECPECEGKGKIGESFCITCSGTGQIKKLCSQCHGTGYDDWLDNECISCNGTGTARKEINWTLSNVIVANLQFIFSFLNTKVNSEQQELEIIIYRGHDPEGVDINGRVNTSITEWLKGIKEKSTSSILKIMRDIYYYLDDSQPNEFQDFNFSMKISPESGFFYLDCPGNATGIYAGNTRLDSEIYSHNVDTPMQVLTLLAGLLKMNHIIVGVGG